MNLRYCIQTGVAALAATLCGVSCTDTWDDHYRVVDGVVPGATIWENMLKDEALRPFAAVLDSCGYASLLNSQQTYTVWAPVITEAEAEQLINTYKQAKEEARQERRTLREEDNPTVHEFIRNHIALFNIPISELTVDTVRMMNGKLMSLTGSELDGMAHIDPVAVPSSNGVLYKVDQPVAFTPNLWEAIQAKAVGGDNGLDSLYRFFLRWEREELNEEASVPGGVVDGETFYLDSVMYSYNSMFNIYGDLDSEDSLYWYLAPTNKVWREGVEKRQSYFNYLHYNPADAKYNEENDSLRDIYSKLMMLENTFFNIRHQPGEFNMENPDSICSTSYTSFYPGYHEFERPLGTGGILDGLTPEEYSNGRLYTCSEWRVPDNKSLYMKPIKVEAEDMESYITIPRKNVTSREDSLAVQATRRTAVNPEFSVSGNAYLMVRDTRPSTNNNFLPGVTFKIPNVLSNCPYDIKVVFATPLAYDAYDTKDAALPRWIKAYTYHYLSPDYDNMIAPSSARQLPYSATSSIKPDYVEVDAMKMDTVTVSGPDGYVFPVCTYNETKASTYLTIETFDAWDVLFDPRATNCGWRLYIDCIILEPRIQDTDE